MIWICRIGIVEYRRPAIGRRRCRIERAVVERLHRAGRSLLQIKRPIRDVLRRPAVRRSQHIGAHQMIAHGRLVHIRGLLAFQAPVVERQQVCLVKRDAVEVGRRLEHVGRAGDQELLRRIDALVADDVALQVQLDLGPDPDGEHRDCDLVELLEGGPLLPERVDGTGSILLTNGTCRLFS